jgi:hypothetical protein
MILLVMRLDQLSIVITRRRSSIIRRLTLMLLMLIMVITRLTTEVMPEVIKGKNELAIDSKNILVEIFINKTDGDIKYLAITGSGRCLFAPSK